MRRLILIVLGLLLAFGLWWRLTSGGDHEASGARETVGPAEAPASPLTSSPAPSRPPPLASPPGPAAGSTPSAAPGTESTRAPGALAVAPASSTRRPRWGVETPEAERAQVEDEDLTMIWSTDKDGIQGAVASKIGVIKECYEGWLKAEPALTGRLKVRFTIDSLEGSDGLAGVVGAQVLDTELDHVWMEGCVLNSLDGLVFERPGAGPLNVTFPFAFDASEDEDAE